MKIIQKYLLGTFLLLWIVNNPVFSANCPTEITNSLADYNIVYINGVWNTPTNIMNSTRETERLLNFSSARIQQFINRSIDTYVDLIETYRFSDMEGNDDTLLFWSYMIDIVSAPQEFKKMYYESMDNHSALTDINALNDFGVMLSKYENLEFDKTIFISHSEGNFFSNNLLDRIIYEDELRGEGCNGIVAVGTPSERVANDGAWVTNYSDDIINLARLLLPNGSNIKASNVYLSPVNNPFDSTGHKYIETYIDRPQTSEAICNSIASLVTKIDEKCIETGPSCGEPLDSPLGGQGKDQRFTYKLMDLVKQQVNISFESYYIPDRLRVYGNGVLLLDSGEVQGFNSYTVNYDPDVHGHSLSIRVDAPISNTAWRFCVGCKGNQSTCNLNSPSMRKEVSFVVSTGSWWTCDIQSHSVNGLPIAFSDEVLLTVGTHQYEWTPAGSCYCDASDYACNIDLPSINIDGQIIPLPSYNQNYKLLFNVN